MVSDVPLSEALTTQTYPGTILMSVVDPDLCSGLCKTQQQIQTGGWGRGERKELMKLGAGLGETSSLLHLKLKLNVSVSNSTKGQTQN